jgi:hypothetical protein
MRTAMLDADSDARRASALAPPWQGKKRRTPMVDPTGVFPMLNAVRTANNAISTQVEEARILRQDDARYYATYLDIAREAIAGLEQAYIEILVKAAHTDLADEQQKKRLLTLIDSYIHGEILRPRLQDAITHLESGKDTLRQHAERLLIWPSAKKNRSAALEQYERLLGRLRDYHGQLGAYAELEDAYDEASAEASAVGLVELFSIRREVNKPTGSFEDKINDLLVDLDKSNLTSISRDCALVIETLRTAFR